MSRVAVVTDTTQYLPAEMLDAHGIRTVSLYIDHGDRKEREADITDLDAYYRRLRDADPLPKTSAPSIGDFLDVYEPLLAEGRDIVSIHLSGGISGTVGIAQQAAEQAQSRHPDRKVRVIDSRSACGGMGLSVLAAGVAAKAGADLDTVANRATQAAEQAGIWFAVDTLEYLRRGGRIGGAQAWLGGALKIKPILTIRGEITPIERVRTSRRAFERMVAFAEELREKGWDAWAVQHIQAPDVAEQLAERGREIFGSDPLFVSEIGPVIGTHVGPGLLGVGGMPAALLRAD